MIKILSKTTFLSSLVFFLTIGILGVSSMTTKANSGQIKAEEHTLANGLKIIILPCGVAPVVTVGMLVHVGTADDPVDEVGLSHFLEHMMFKGTKTVPSDRFKKQIIQLGGQTNALTEFDYTLYYTTISKNYLETILKLEADRLQNLTFSKEEVESEKKVVLEERNMRIENNPMGSLYERYLQARNPYHPYGVLPIGFPHHIKKYTYESARAHYDRWYHPNNTTFIISGSVTLKEVLPLVEKYFGSYEKKEIPEQKRIQNPDFRDGVTHTIVQYNKRNSIIMSLVSFDAPCFNKLKERPLYYALTVLENILGTNPITHFSQTLIEKEKVALQVDARYNGDSVDNQDFVFSALLAPSMKIEDFKAKLFSYLEKISKEGVDESELKLAKSLALEPFYTIKDGTDKFVLSTARFIGRKRTIKDINEYQTSIEKVTGELLKEAVKEFFIDNKPAVTLELYPA